MAAQRSKTQGCLRSSAIDRRLGLQKLQIAIGKLANYVQQALVKTFGVLSFITPPYFPFS